MSNCDKHLETTLIAGYCPQCEWNATGDEFLIIACGDHYHHICRWSRQFLETAKSIADGAISLLGYDQATVYNIYKGNASSALYIATPSGGKDMVET
jgi:hypothetical protein